MYTTSHFISLIVALIALSVSADEADINTVEATLPINEQHPGKCVFSKQLILSPGETKRTPKSCAEVKCLNGEGRIALSACAPKKPPIGCKWGDYIDVNAPFTECCARHLKCRDAAAE